MAPKPYLDQAGNGHHLHLSLTPSRTILRPLRRFASSAPQARGSSAGLLEHLPAVMAFTAPSPNSTSAWLPACGLPPTRLRARQPRGRRAAHLSHGRRRVRDRQRRVQAHGRDREPYLALAAVLAAGMDAIERDLDPGEPATVDPATLSDDERASRGIYPSPASLDEALDALEGNEVLIRPSASRSCTYLAVGRAQAKMAKDLSPEEVAASAAMIY